VLYAGLYSLSVNYQDFTITNPLNRSTAIREKISFYGRQKSGGRETSSFVIFGCVAACANYKCAWLCGLIIH